LLGLGVCFGVGGCLGLGLCGVGFWRVVLCVWGVVFGCVLLVVGVGLGWGAVGLVGLCLVVVVLLWWGCLCCLCCLGFLGVLLVLVLVVGFVLGWWGVVGFGLLLLGWFFGFCFFLFLSFASTPFNYGVRGVCFFWWVWVCGLWVVVSLCGVGLLAWVGRLGREVLIVAHVELAQLRKDLLAV
ncbi:hypothetical protein, partial [Pseudomonas syringae group genomosp. 7]|uniref:hypothetical protein n=1 Tax=Pseudomonas syringae group genomosp. 7 TaxID=251699 RepID=UPI0037700078